MSDLNEKYEVGFAPTASAADTPKIEWMCDMSSLALGLAAVMQWADEHSDTMTPEKSVEIKQLLAKGVRIARTHVGVFNQGLQEHFGSLIDEPKFAVLRQPWERANRPAKLAQALALKGAFLALFLPRVRKEPQLFRELFAKRAYNVALKLNTAAAEEDASTRIHHLALVPSISRLRAPSKWLKEAAAVMNVEPTEAEIVQSQAESIQPVIEELREVNTNIDVADPDDAEGVATLEERKAMLQAEIEEEASDSENPEALRASAVSQLAEEPTSTVAQEMGMTDEQTRAMMAMGKTLMPAGAGSGKTRVMSGKILHLVKEKGFRPEEIMATSFTRKSALELKDRVEKLGVTGANIGTTHSLSFKLISTYAPEKVQAMKGAMGGIPDRLMRVAVAQVGLRNKGPGQRHRNINAYYKTAIGEWFNLGVTPMDHKGRAIGSKRLKNYIGKWKMGGWSPEEAWAFYKAKGRDYPTAYYAAAAYGAYEWLKSEQGPEGEVYDFDDWLIQAKEVLETNDSARKAMQRRYRAVLVDEAQDLNETQHAIFDMVGENAEVYAYVGDDKQAIYSFRGAVPERFINKPEQGFAVTSLTTNFRSGKAIVDAANKLIAHNEKQIPMACNANERRKGLGVIKARTARDHEKAAVEVAQEIASMIENGSSPDDFGIVIRNNAEADAYAMTLMAKGIPFRSKSNPFDKPIIKAMLSWMRIAVGGSEAAVNEAVLIAHRTPGFFIDKQFQAQLQRRCGPGESYLDYILAGKPVYGTWRDRNVREYAEALRDVSQHKGTAAEVMDFILQLQGAKETFMESLVQNINADDIAEALGREPTEEELTEAALVPVRPLLKVGARFADPAKMLHIMDSLKRANEVHNKSKNGDSPSGRREPSVMIDTVHQWKGLEAKNIYVSMAANVFPPPSDLMDRDSAPDPHIHPQTMEDERRLAYVAITRGEDSVTIMCPMENYRGQDGGISPFVEEACIAVEGMEASEDDSDEEGAPRLAAVEEVAPVDRDADFTVLSNFMEGW